LYGHADPRRQRPQVAQVYAIPAMATSNRVTLIYDLLTSRSMYTERLL